MREFEATRVGASYRDGTYDQLIDGTVVCLEIATNHSVAVVKAETKGLDGPS